MEHLQINTPQDKSLFIEYIKHHFSEKFTEQNFRVLLRTIGDKKFESILTKVQNFLNKNREIDFEHLYNEIAPAKNNSIRYIPKMKNFIGHIFNFLKNKQKPTTTVQIEYGKEQSKNQLTEILNTNDIIIQKLLKDFCTIKNIREFKHYFAGEYKKTDEYTGFERLRECIGTMCKKAINNLSPEDIVSYDQTGNLSIRKANDATIEKYNDFANNEDNEQDEAIYQPEGNTVENILIDFFNDHKIEIAQKSVNKTPISQRRRAINRSTGDAIQGLLI